MSKKLRLDRIEPTPQQHFLNRRQFLTAAGACGTVAAVAAIGYRLSPLRSDASSALANVEAPPLSQRQMLLRPGIVRPEVLKRFPAQRNPA